jgi:hypothetical protein
MLMKSVILETKKQTSKPTKTCPYSTPLALTKTVVRHLRKIVLKMKIDKNK